ncbi:hypothetical protein V6N13_001759 [Hibiscus sabdariffa]|uniref:Uncharacterized protein n=2 Tax=Hibiscus sabdariffa TaxID=183260 RepID=A0ABR2G980_9ROSI
MDSSRRGRSTRPPFFSRHFCFFRSQPNRGLFVSALRSSLKFCGGASERTGWKWTEVHHRRRGERKRCELKTLSKLMLEIVQGSP